MNVEGGDQGTKRSRQTW